jgi:hypothetical protein
VVGRRGMGSARGRRSDLTATAPRDQWEEEGGDRVDDKRARAFKFETHSNLI